MRGTMIMLALFFLPIQASTKSVQSQDANNHERLEWAITHFKDGDYKKAADSLAVLVPLLSGTDQKEGYKYFGFSLAMLNRVDQAKAAFTTALEKFPEMDIDTLEVQPTIAIVFKQAKLEKKLAIMDTAIKKKPTVIVQKKNVVLPVTLLVCGIISAGVSANLFYFGYQDLQKYNAITVPGANFDHYYYEYRNLFIGGGISAGVAAVLIPVSIVMLAKKDPLPHNVSLSLRPNGVGIAFSF
jgi:tetratricopeptide (TPR) repeat protein